jgi:hypothetical protein
MRIVNKAISVVVCIIAVPVITVLMIPVFTWDTIKKRLDILRGDYEIKHTRTLG